MPPAVRQTGNDGASPGRSAGPRPAAAKLGTNPSTRHGSAESPSPSTKPGQLQRRLIYATLTENQIPSAGVLAIDFPRVSVIVDMG
jgi:hypothetical protein